MGVTLGASPDGDRAGGLRPEPPAASQPIGAHPLRGFAAIGLVSPKTPTNYAGVLRAAHAFGASLIVIQGGRFKNGFENTSRAERHLPVLSAESIFDAVPYGAKTVAVEIVEGSRSLFTFAHPRQAFYIFGPEDGSIPASIVERCDYAVQIPTRLCLNLAATANVVLYDRAAKAVR